MYKVTPPRINTGIGQGAAQVFGSNAVDLSGLGYAAGYNSEGAKKVRQQKELKNKLDSVDPDYSKYTPAVAEGIRQAVEDYRNWSYEHAGDEDFEEKFNQKGQDLAFDIEQGIAASSYYKNKDAAISSYDAMEVDNHETFTKARNPEFWQKEDGSKTPLREMYAKMYAIAEETGVRNDIMPEIPTYTLSSQEYSVTDDNGTRGTKSLRFSPEVQEVAESNAKTFVMSGLNSVNGTTDTPVLANANWTERTLEEFKREKANEISALGNSPEAEKQKEQLYIDYAVNKRMQEVRVKSGEKKDSFVRADNTTKEEDGSGTLTREDILNGLTAKSENNILGVVPDGEDVPVGAKMGSNHYMVAPSIEAQVKIDIGGATVGGTTKEVVIKDGKRMAIVNYKVKEGKDPNSPKNVFQTKYVPYEEIASQLTKKQASQYEQSFEVLEEIPEDQRSYSIGMNKDEISTLKAYIESKKSGDGNDEVNATEVIKRTFGDTVELVGDADPNGRDDLSFKFKGEDKEYSYDLNTKSGLVSFLKLAEKRGLGKVKESKENTSKIDDDFIQSLGGNIR